MAAVEITILSGVRQGQQIVLDATRFRAGPDPGCEIYFDPSADSSARDRSVILTLMDDGWYIQSTGRGEVFVNQSAVVALTRIRSGSIVRMSEFGPEFEFRIQARGPAANDRHGATSVAGAQAFSPVPSWPSQPAPTSFGASPAPFQPAPAQEPARPVGPSPSTGDSGRLAVMMGGGVLFCLVLAILVKVAMTPSVVVLQSPEKPEKAVAEHPVQTSKEPPKDSAAPKDTPAASEAPPVPSPKKQEDPVFARLKDAVLLIQVEKAGKSWPFATCCAVSDNTVLTSAREALRLGLWMKDPATGFKGWVTNPTTGLRLPVQEARLYAVSLGSPDKEKPNDWLYTNLGLVTVQGTLPKTVELASPDESAQLTPGKAVHAFSYIHEGDLITPEDHLEPKDIPGKILLINQHPDLPGKPRLLTVKAEWPRYPLGCPLVNGQGKVVAVYADPADATSDGKDVSPGTGNLHYATVIDPGVVDLWLKKSDRSVWPAITDLKLPAEDARPSASGAKSGAADSKGPKKTK